MASDDTQLHMLFFPYMGRGHLIPMIDMAKLFASRGVKITFLTTPLNSISISESLISFSPQIHLLTIKFPSAEVGLPDGCESVDSIVTPSMFPKFISAYNLLQTPFEDVITQHRPDCLLVDMIFPWVDDVAAKFGIPRLNFFPTGFFSLCALEFMRVHQPYTQVSSETEPFLIPSLPGEITFTKSKLHPYLLENVNSFFSDLMESIFESGGKSYGVVINSFYELEAEYADCYRDVLGRKIWSIGPLTLCNNNKSHRGGESSIDEHECLKWLNSKKSNSVVYVCFGSLTKFNSSQLKEMANGLEASGQNFIWVVRKGENEEDNQNWLSKGFEQRMEGKGLIIRGWAPQVLILDHPAVGGFVTHCGWNSTLEGVAAGVPMVTWPVASDHFYNEKLVTEVLKIGVAVGVQKWVKTEGDFIESEAVEKAMKRIMDWDEAEEMRNRANKLAEMAWRAVAENGSSHSELDVLINEMKSFVF